MKRIVIALIGAYRYLLSPWWGGQCRFTPTCSEYAMQAVECHGCARGSWVALRRIARCHPWRPGGFDPVPGKHHSP